MRAAVMQPYFFPYAGYFRLAAASDVFVVLDNVQFPRRGWVHRNRLHLANGDLEWLTLPIAKAAQSVLIQELQYQTLSGSEQEDWRSRQLRRFPALASVLHLHPDIACLALEPAGSPAAQIESGIRRVLALLDIERPLVKASELGIPQGLRAQELIIALTKAVGADSYINAPGGRDIYNAHDFARAGVDLGFLPPYQGSFASVLERLATSTPSKIAQELLAQCQIEK
ncbi:MAG: WbqC family protein [Dechloromonas sp.]|nr:MAG: WbqC family protein [Dechloromonas sp.]